MKRPNSPVSGVKTLACASDSSLLLSQIPGVAVMCGRGWIFLTLLGHVGWVHSSQLPPVPYCSITAILGAPSPIPRELRVRSYSQRPTFSSSLQALVILSPLCRLTKSQDISLEAEQEKFSHMRVSLSNHKKYIFNPTNYVFTIYNGQGVCGKGAVIRKNMNQLFSCCNFKSLVIPSDERDVETITHRCACTREPIQSSRRLLPSACRVRSKTQGYFWEDGISTVHVKCVCVHTSWTHAKNTSSLVMFRNIQ